MSFKPTLRLDYSTIMEQRITDSKRSVSDWLKGYVKNVTATPIQSGPIWEGDVVFIEDGDTGRYIGRAESYFVKNGETHIKFTSGDILVLEFASYIQ